MNLMSDSSYYFELENEGKSEIRKSEIGNGNRKSEYKIKTCCCLYFGILLFHCLEEVEEQEEKKRNRNPGYATNKKESAPPAGVLYLPLFDRTR